MFIIFVIILIIRVIIIIIIIILILIIIISVSNTLSIKKTSTHCLSQAQGMDPVIMPYYRIKPKEIQYSTVEPRLSGLVGTTRNSPDNRGSG